MSLSLLLTSSGCLAEEADDSGAEVFLTPPEGEAHSATLACVTGRLPPVCLHQEGQRIHLLDP